MKNTTKFGIVGIGAACALLTGVTVVGVAGSNPDERSAAIARTSSLSDQTSSLASGSPHDEALLWRVANILATDPSVAPPAGPGATIGDRAAVPRRTSSGHSASGSAAAVPSGTGTWCGCPTTASGTTTSSSSPTGSGWNGTVTPTGTGTTGTGAAVTGNGAPNSGAASASGTAAGNGVAAVVTGATSAVGDVVSGVTGLLSH